MEKNLIKLKIKAEKLYDEYLDAYNSGEHERKLHDLAAKALDAYNDALTVAVEVKE